MIFRDAPPRLLFFTEGAVREKLRRIPLSENECRDSPEGGNLLGDEQIVFMNGIKKAAFSNDLILDSLSRSIETKIFFERKFNKKDIDNKSFSKSLINDICHGKKIDVVAIWGRWRQDAQYCSEQDKALLQKLIKVKAGKILQAKSKPLSGKQVAQDLSQKITQINEIFKGYNREKDTLEQQWDKEDEKINKSTKAYRYHEGPKRHAERKKELLRLKKSAFDRYRELYASLYEDESGILLQTKAIKKFAKFDELEKVSAKYMGLGGFNTKVLEDMEDFPMLQENIDAATAKKAVQEALGRTKDQVRDLFKRKKIGPRMDNLAHLVRVNPVSVGSVLINNPQYSNVLCSVIQEMSRQDRNHSVAETGGYLIIGAGTIAAGIATMGGSLPLTATAAGLLLSAGATMGDYAYQKGQAAKRKKSQADLLNALMAGTGDKKSIDEIREEWKRMLENEYGAWIALGVAPLDILGIRIAVRTLGAAKMASSIVFPSGANAKNNRKLLYRIAETQRYSKGFRKLVDQNSPEKMGEFLNFVSELPRKEQRIVLDNFSNSSDLAVLARLPQVRQGLTKDQLQNLDQMASQGKSNQKIDIVTNNAFAPILKNFSSEEQNVIVEAIQAKKIQGKSEKQILDEIQEAVGKCTL